MNVMTQVARSPFKKEVPEIDTYDARELVNGGVQARIVLDAQVYYLRITRAGKLILTK